MIHHSFLLLFSFILFVPSFSQGECDKNKIGLVECPSDSGASQFYYYTTKGAAEGIATEYDEKNRMILTGYFKDNKPEKEWKRYDAGELSQVLYFKNGKLYGLKEYYDGGNLLREGFFENGLKVGLWKYYFDNGYPEIVESYAVINQNGSMQSVIHGESRRYHYNGQLSGIEFYINGKIHGEKTEYYENGQLEGIYHFEYGKWAGSFLSYHDNGQLSCKGNYKNGVAQGPWEYYHPNGQLEKIVSFIGIFKEDNTNEMTSIPDGEIKKYYENGQIAFCGNFIKGKEEGLWLTYYANGKTASETNYKNGLLHGEALLYSVEGKLTEKSIYENGNFIEKISY